MTGATPVYGLPYPTGTDRLDAAVTTIPQALATAVESTLTSFGGIAAPTAWAAASLVLPAANLGGGYATAGYRKAGSIVRLKGTVTTPTAIGAGTTLFSLPVGFRPTANRAFLCPGATPIRIDITAAGAVIVQTALAAGSGFVGLDGCWFDTDG